MKKIIEGKKYDTETAKRLAHFDNGYSCTDFCWCEMELYRKKTGEFFLHGAGNAASGFGHRCIDGTMGPGEKIIPLSEKKAREYVERFCDVEEYESIFGECSE